MYAYLKKDFFEVSLICVRKSPSDSWNFYNLNHFASESSKFDGSSEKDPLELLKHYGILWKMWGETENILWLFSIRKENKVIKHYTDCSTHFFPIFLLRIIHDNLNLFHNTRTVYILFSILRTIMVLIIYTGSRYMSTSEEIFIQNPCQVKICF